LASAFLVSPFEEAAVASIDGFGDYVSTMWGHGHGNDIDILDQVYIPHSLGIFYLAMTQFLGFMKYGDEYKVMGLAAYGRPSRLQEMEKIVRLAPKGKFAIGLEYFRHHTLGVDMNWENGEPEIGQIFTPALEQLLGPARKADEPLTDMHRDIAASIQAMYETAFFHVINQLHEKAASPKLCLAGGCAMNSVANGKLFERSPFKELYVQPAAGDAGGAIGAALSVWHESMDQPRRHRMIHANVGPSYDDGEIASLLDRHRDALRGKACLIERVEDVDQLCRRTIESIAQGGVIGWFQGKMEWGPRALGNRSILCDPRRADMKDLLNSKIKRRESFRPFAPAILRQAVSEWFETDCDVPFMTQVLRIRKDKQEKIPAVTHVDGTGRLQTVDKEANPLFHSLIQRFGEQTGVPILLNTSFNENEPIVCTPEEALDCFLRTKMDMLVLGDVIVARGP
jgi:carbamoyltransferase